VVTKRICSGRRLRHNLVNLASPNGFVSAMTLYYKDMTVSYVKNRAVELMR